MPTSIDVFAKAREHERLEQLKLARETCPAVLPRAGGRDAAGRRDGGRPRIMLGSNNYLGLTCDERVKQGAQDALAKYGTGLTGSRFLNGTIDLHVELERELAEWMNVESAIVFTTGHQANIGVLGTILVRTTPWWWIPATTARFSTAVSWPRRRCGHSGTTDSTGSSTRSSEPRTIAVAFWSSSTASSRWRATLRRYRRSPICVNASAPGSWWTRRTPSAYSVLAGRASANCSASRTASIYAWPRSPRRWRPAAG